MQKKKKWTFILTFLIGAVSVAFLSAALATEYWLVARPTRKVDDETEDGAKNVTDGDPGTKFNGYIHFGLFHGHKSLDHGLGIREGEIWSVDDAEEHGLFNFGLWVSTIIFMALAIIWGLVGMGFSVLNATTKPIETITGPMGLYVWNTCACLFTLLSLIMYVVLFYQDLRKNVLSQDDRDIYLWTSENKAHLDYSFYFVVASSVLYSLNLLVVGCSGVQCRSINYANNINNKAMDGVMMY